MTKTIQAHEIRFFQQEIIENVTIKIGEMYVGAYSGIVLLT
jgi:hypothetical protein